MGEAPAPLAETETARVPPGDHRSHGLGVQIPIGGPARHAPAHLGLHPPDVGLGQIDGLLEERLVAGRRSEELSGIKGLPRGRKGPLGALVELFPCIRLITKHPA
jgi:hypothetical protein